MSKLESYAIFVEPLGFDDGYIYRVQVMIDGELHQNIRTTVEIPPHMAELDVLNRMTQQIIHKLREEDEQSPSSR